MSDEQEQTEVWPFAPSYESSYSSLPPSQLRECIKRLSSRARNPLSAEAITQENAEVEGVLSAVKKAYLAKKDRAKLASAAKRATQRELKPDNVAVEVEAEPSRFIGGCGGSPTVEDITAAVADLSLEVAEVVAVEPEPEPEPEPVKPAPSKPIPVPSRIPVARQPAAAAAAPRNQPKKVGLAAKFA